MISAEEMETEIVPRLNLATGALLRTILDFDGADHDEMLVAIAATLIQLEHRLGSSW